MKNVSRRAVIKGGLSLPASTLLSGSPVIAVAESIAAEPASRAAAVSPRERLLLDFGWRFHHGHASDPNKDFGFSNGRSREFQKTGSFLPAAALAFDDSNWQQLDLPHDWVIGLPFKNDPSLASKGFYPIGRSYPENSVGWYRRILDIPASDKGKRISIEFDGAYREAIVVCNGYYIGQHRGGYDPFRFDLTDFILPGQPNVFLVRVEASLSDGWYYEGAGIYRHTWLVKTAPVHVRQWGTFVRATLQGNSAAIKIRTEIDNQDTQPRDVRIVSSILDASGKAVAKTTSTFAPLAVDEGHNFEQQTAVSAPALWSLEKCNLYTLLTEVEVAGAIVDRYESRFGIRSIHFDADQGFFLNGKSIKIKGTCNHQDHAGLGVALPDAAQAFRVRTLQGMGCNAYRASHNPPTPELLDACDEMGMLFLDETRMMSSNPEGMSQFENLVRRDRNHPCVFMWNMGNEERESQTAVGLNILTAMKKTATRLDGSRPVTVAPPPLGFGLGTGGLAVSDVMGYNYADPQIEMFHKANPNIPCMGTENVSAVATRGIYKLDPENGFTSSYDPYTSTGRASAEGWWRFVNARRWMPGGFVWTGFDYRGEPSPYQWPNTSSQYGVLDNCGFPKDTYFYYQSWWTSEPVLHIFPHWNWPGLEGKLIAVWVHTNMDRVELFQDGKSLGAKDVPKDSHVAWNAAYKPGVLEARGFRNGQQIMVKRRETTGKAAKLVLKTDRQQLDSDGQDLAFYTVEVQDAESRVVPVTNEEVTFKVTGSGKLIGNGNGDPTSQESDIGPTRKAFSGLCMGIVQASKSAGAITIEVTSPNLKSASATIEAKPVALQPQVPEWTRQVPAGSGVTGLWRPAAPEALPGADPLQLAIAGDTLYTLIQNGSTLSGTLEAPAGGFGPGGGAGGGLIQGSVEGGRVSFTVGAASYIGTVTGDRMQLRKTTPPRPEAPSRPADASPTPIIGPPPDGSDPSFGNRNGVGPSTILLKRADR